MTEQKVAVPDKVESEITHLVQKGEFLNREQAIEELLSMGSSADDTGQPATEAPGEDVFTQSMEDQRDPAMDTGQGDEYTF